MLPADALRLAAALLVAANHTGPLADVNAAADFFLCHVLARLAVPYFWLLTGHFVLPKGRAAVRRQAGRLLRLYAAVSLCYLPLSVHAGYWPDAAAAVRRLLMGETFYHLWYLPATAFGLMLAAALWRYTGPRAALALAAALYAFGAAGNAWYPVAGALPGVRAVLALCGTTRGGLFFAPLFLLLGRLWAQRPLPLPRWGLALALPALTAEAFWLRAQNTVADPAANDSMYLLLPACVLCLLPFVDLRADRPPLRRWAAAVYLWHPWTIALLHALPVCGSLAFYAAVCALTLAVCAPWAFRSRPDPTARCWIELDRSALAHNVQALRAALPPDCALMPAVKADAYGHGAVGTARALRRLGVRAFCVACVDEGAALRRAGVRGEILVLGWTSPRDFPRLRRWRLTQTVADAAHAAAMVRYGRPLRVHIKVDTGMHRLGLPWQDTDAIAALFGCKSLRITGMFTHLCTDDTAAAADMAFAETQLARFAAVCRALLDRGITPPPCHVQSSTGILRHGDLDFRYARPGIALYGMLSDPDATARWGAALRPVLSLRCRVAAVHALPAGEGAGYGLACRADRPLTLAVLTAGYADGISRALSGGAGQVLIRGRRCAIVGRVCMDQLFADVTAVPGTAPGDIATLIGRGGGETITACEQAAAAGTIANELLSRLGARPPRTWV